MTTAPPRPKTGQALAIEVTDLVRTYTQAKTNVRALDGLTLQVPTGSIFGLLGPNGAGKSTTVRILTTLGSADGGRATVAGYDVGREAAQVREVIGYVPQKSCFDPKLTGRQDLCLQGRIHGLSRRAAADRAAELLDRFNLTAAADRPSRTWSGGMQRKLDVALGLVHRPQVLFLDEPTTGLDPEARAEMWSEISSLASAGLTVLLTTHYLDEADHLTDQLAIVDRGRVVATGSPDQLKAQLARDAIQVELDDHRSAEAARALAETILAGSGTVTVVDATLRIEVADGASAMPKVLTALNRSAIELVSITLARPSLDDVYLRHAGRTFEAADALAAKAVA